MGFNNVDVFMHRHPGCYGTLPLGCLMGATVRWWSRGRGLEEEERKKRRGRVGGVLLYGHIPGTFPKWTPALLLPRVTHVNQSKFNEPVAV